MRAMRSLPGAQSRATPVYEADPRLVLVGLAGSRLLEARRRVRGC